LLLALLHSRLGGLEDRLLLSSVTRAGIGTLVAAFVIQGPVFLLAQLPEFALQADQLPSFLSGLKGLIAAAVNMQTFLGVATQLVGSLAGGSLVFLVVARLLGSPEISLLREIVAGPRRSSPSFPGTLDSD
jgi:hypothetical protein